MVSEKRDVSVERQMYLFDALSTASRVPSTSITSERRQTSTELNITNYTYC